MDAEGARRPTQRATKCYFLHRYLPVENDTIRVHADFYKQGACQ